jgi:hypothetical protein
MMRDIRGFIGVLAWTGVLVVGSEARAQYGGTSSSGTGASNLGMMANPYMNPYLNPYLNPYATNQRMSAGNAALYLFSAQAASGGIGSGQLSGVRPGARTPGARESVPGQRGKDDGHEVRGVPPTAARYFMRGTQKPAASSFYNRQGRYYSNPRH